MALFKNQTLTLVRDQYACVVNNYGYNSSAPANVLETLNTAGFAAYQAFGFLFTITNLVLLIVVLAKLDFPKACSLAKFEDNIVSSLFAWLFVNLGLASSNSFIYLVYGGLFNLDLDPCLARPRTNNLMYIFKN